MQREHLRIACQTQSTPLLLHTYAIRVACPPYIRQRQGCVRRIVITSCGSGSRPGMVCLLSESLSSDVSNIDHLLQDLLNGGAQVLHQMKAVSDLDSIGCPLPAAFSQCAGTVTRDNLDTGMDLQPGSEGLRTRIGKHLKWSIGAEVNQDGFEVQAFAIRPFVHTKKRGGC